MRSNRQSSLTPFMYVFVTKDYFMNEFIICMHLTFNNNKSYLISQPIEINVKTDIPPCSIKLGMGIADLKN